jgi:hypothetical protein
MSAEHARLRVYPSIPPAAAATCAWGPDYDDHDNFDLINHVDFA